MNKELYDRYMNLKNMLLENTDRKESIDKYFKVLEDNTDWLSSPASTKYHNSFEGGLLDHTCNVAETALRIRKILCPEVSVESTLLCALVHDHGKIGQYVVKEPTEKQKKYGYPGSIAWNTEITQFPDHAMRSLYMAMSMGVTFTEEEAQAILYHNQPYDGNSLAWKDVKLTWLIQVSDYYSAHFIEKG